MNFLGRHPHQLSGEQRQRIVVERTELESFKQLLKLLGERGLVANLGIQAGSVSSQRSIPT